MASKHRHEPEILGPVHEGEFRRISGIGPGIEQRLRAAGISTFDQFASLSADEIVTTLDNLVGITQERILQQDWTGQAQKFASELRKSNPPADMAEPEERQHYQSFMIELLIDDERSVRRTRVVHVQGNHIEHWAGWDPGRLGRWIEAQAGLQTALDPPEVEERARAEMYAPISGSLQIVQPQVTSAEVSPVGRIFWSGEAIDLRLSLDLRQVEGPQNESLLYQVVVRARKLGTGRHEQVGEAAGECLPGQVTDVTLRFSGLEEGVYRLEIAGRVYPADSAHPQRSGLQAISEGGLILVQTAGIEAGR